MEKNDKSKEASRKDFIDKRKKKKKKRNRRIIISIVIILIFIIVGAMAWFFNTLNGIKKVEINSENLSINSSTETKSTEEFIKNIALFGVDSFDGETGRSDSIIIATIDSKNKKLKLSSIMRDSYVDIPDHGKDKINHAFAYGGAELAIKTINENYGLNIADYAKVDFNGMEDLINALGGIDIAIRDDEIDNFNEHIRHLSKNAGVSPEYFSQAGTYHMNGLQALAYCRIRYSTDNGGDAERTSRHRIVLTKIFDKIMSSGVTQFPSLVSKVSPYIETSLSNGEIISLGTTVFTSGVKTMEQERFPLNSYMENLMVDGVYYLGFDKEVTKTQIQNYIYKDIKPSEKKEEDTSTEGETNNNNDNNNSENGNSNNNDTNSTDTNSNSYEGSGNQN